MELCPMAFLDLKKTMECLNAYPWFVFDSLPQTYEDPWAGSPKKKRKLPEKAFPESSKTPWHFMFMTNCL
jgi:hypothetical protein